MGQEKCEKVFLMYLFRVNLPLHSSTAQCYYFTTSSIALSQLFGHPHQSTISFNIAVFQLNKSSKCS